MIDDNAYTIPHISKQCAEYLKDELSTDRQIAGGLLSDSSVVRSEAYLLGFLAGLGYSRQVLDTMVENQDSMAEESDTMLRDLTTTDITESWLNV